MYWCLAKCEDICIDILQSKNLGGRVFRPPWWFRPVIFIINVISTDPGDERKSDEVWGNAVDGNKYLLFGKQDVKHVGVDSDKRLDSDKLH